MTLDVFPDPRVDVADLLGEFKTERASTALLVRKAPTALGTVPVIQYAWDGTPGQQANRQTAAVRLTVWGWKVSTGATTWTTSETDMVNLAQKLSAWLLEAGSSETWQFRPGLGPLADVDDDSKIPFCTFTLNAETRPTRVA